LGNEKIDKEEVWSANRYLDPDESEKEKKANVLTIIATLALLLMLGGVWVLFWFRLRQP
jgi:flagellar basal body-associated protein FliL